MSVAAMKWADVQDLSDAQGKGVLGALARLANSDGICFPSASTLAKRTGKSESTVRRHLRLLKCEGFILSEDGKRADLSQGSNTYLLLMGQSTLLPWAKTDANLDRVPVNMDRVPVRVTPLENVGRKLVVKPSLSSEEEKNQKLELLQGAFGDDFKLIDEVEGRRDAWLGLSPETIADAIERVTGRVKFRTDLKNELDALANVSVPQSARRSAPVKQSTSHDAPGAVGRSGDARLERYVPVPGERNPAENAKRWEERLDRAQRETEQGEQASRQRLWAQARALEGGCLPNGPGPPNSPPTPATIEPGGSNHAHALPPTPRRAGPSSLRPPRHRRGTPGATSGAGGGGPP